MIPVSRLRDCEKILSESTTPIQMATRTEIYNRLMRYIRESPDEKTLFQKIVVDYPVFTLAFIDNLSGDPVYLAKWQIEAGQMLDKYPNVWLFVSRRAGKTTLLASKQVQLAALNAGWRFIDIAPTKKQDYMFRNITRCFNGSDFLFREFCGSQKNAVLKESISLVNGVEFMYKNVGLQQEGELIRGESANLIAIDEIQTIPMRAYTSVIVPILSDDYGDKRLWLIGTPSLLYNPELDDWWERWESCTNESCNYKFEAMEDDCPVCGRTRTRATIRVDWSRAVEEGCLNRDRVLESMAFMTQDEILMEYEASFPKEEGRFFNKGLLHASFRGYAFDGKPRANANYVMSVDWAKHRDRMQIFLARVEGMEKMSLAHWREVDLENVKLTRDEQVELVKDIFHQFNPSWIIPDSTGAQDLYINLMTSGDRPIPKNRIYAHNADKGDYGFIFSGPSVYELYRNYKRLLENGNFVVPNGLDVEDPYYQQFRKKWVSEHHEINTKSSKNRGYLTFEKPRNGYDDMVQACAMLAWYLRHAKPSKPLMAIRTFGNKKKGKMYRR